MIHHTPTFGDYFAAMALVGFVALVGIAAVTELRWKREDSTATRHELAAVRQERDFFVTAYLRAVETNLPVVHAGGLKDREDAQ
jgi:hypothetical protein